MAVFYEAQGCPNGTGGVIPWSWRRVEQAVGVDFAYFVLIPIVNAVRRK